MFTFTTLIITVIFDNRVYFCEYLYVTMISINIALSFCLQEQYDFCYRVVQDFVDIFSDYANFK